MSVEAAGPGRLLDRLQGESHRGDPFAAAIRATRMPMIVTDPHQFDNPIVFANNAFLALTGYERFEVMGRNCRFLQGPETNPGAVARIREAVRNETALTIDLLNYRRDGTTFRNALYLGPVHDDAGALRYFFASQLDVSERYRLLAEIADLKGRLAEAEARLTAG
ncbi:PAS domain-containing protein [Methylobacterium radiodurans]|uniref:Histidine kinase n=1 Tax=Methylobacterium radiodurans TaxID=2202828 RepID=A0A2U8VZF9_9HYPH|nr:histidine kinase [Methylobacterium radiodurans]